MEKLVALLPEHIINHILSYSYNVQPKKLLTDIENYVHVKNKLYTFYYEYWIIKRNYQKNEDLYMLFNDIFGYINEGNQIYINHNECRCCVWGLYDFFRRNYILQNKTEEFINSQIYNMANIMDKPEYLRFLINNLLGLLLPLERNYLIKELEMYDFYKKIAYFYI